MCLDTHIIGTVRETHTHTHIVHTHRQRKDHRSDVHRRFSADGAAHISIGVWVQKRRHQVIKKKSERKNKRGGGVEEKRPVGRKIMDNLMQLRLKTQLVISSGRSNRHVKARGFCHKACQVAEIQKVVLKG